MNIPAPIIEAVSKAVAQAQESDHGQRSAIYRECAQQLGISYATFMRYRQKLCVTPSRKRRADAGKHALSVGEAHRVSALLMEYRGNGKKMMAVGQALEILRNTNSEYRVIASRTDPQTGEIIALSDSAVLDALRSYRLHPDQLRTPAPSTPLQSLYPNHVWQIDASLCVLYYLSNASGMQVMEKKKFNKNKPKNLERVASERVWSYEVTDHYSGAIFVRYVMGAESAQNISDSFIEAIQQRDDLPFYGVPEILMMDKGSANTSGRFKNLLRRLGVKALPHAAENARATGQVEKARDIIERHFESQLRLVPVHSLEELNVLAGKWSKKFNAVNIHSRTSMARFSTWLSIRQEQLRIAPPVEHCRALMTHDAEERRVTQELTINFNGNEYDVRGHDVIVGEKVLVTYSPYKLDCASLVTFDEERNEVLHDIYPVQFNEAGFRVDANVIGQDYKKMPVTQADVNRDVVEQVAMAASSKEEAQAKRKARALLFDGKVNSIDDGLRQMPDTLYIKRQGEVVKPTATVTSIAVQPRVLSHFEAIKELMALGVSPSQESNEMIKRLHPDGVPQDQLEGLKARLSFGAMRVIAGGKD